MQYGINDPHNMLDSFSRRLDAEAAARADLMVDAEEGKILLNRLEAAWWEQGVVAFQMGLGAEAHLERSAAPGLPTGPGTGHAPGGAGMSTNWNGEEKQPGDGCGLVVLLVFVPAIAAMLEVLQWLA